MNILIIGGTRFFGIPMTENLILKGHNITIATRGRAKDTYGNKVSRIVFDRSDESSVKSAFSEKYYDVIIDKIAYSSNDIKRIINNVKYEKYVLTSSSAVYENISSDTKESDFLAENYSLRWGERADYNYAEGKRQAECALALHNTGRRYIAVRYPVVIGKNDYTNRLRFYADCILNNTPMYIDDLDSRISFIHEDEAGLFLSHLADIDIEGAVNGCSYGDISIKEIIEYIESNTKYKAILSVDGTPAPYNGYPKFATLNTDKASKTDFKFSNVSDWIFKILDLYISAYKSS